MPQWDVFVDKSWEWVFLLSVSEHLELLQLQPIEINCQHSLTYKKEISNSLMNQILCWKNNEHEY